MIRLTALLGTIALVACHKPAPPPPVADAGPDEATARVCASLEDSVTHARSQADVYQLYACEDLANEIQLLRIAHPLDKLPPPTRSLMLAYAARAKTCGEQMRSLDAQIRAVIAEPQSDLNRATNAIDAACKTPADGECPAAKVYAAAASDTDCIHALQQDAGVAPPLPAATSAPLKSALAALQTQSAAYVAACQSVKDKLAARRATLDTPDIDKQFAAVCGHPPKAS